MGSYEDAIATLEAELGGVERAFREVSADQWRTSTLVRPLGDSKPHWTLRAGGSFRHLDWPDAC